MPSVAMCARLVYIYHKSNKQFTAMTRIKNKSDISATYKSRFDGLKNEMFIVALLDANNCIIGEHVELGGKKSCAISKRDLFKKALSIDAHAMVMMHNHPSGNANFSADDRGATHDIRHGCRLLGMSLIDHILFHGDDVSSMLERGEIVF